jgi:hypothetical protein
MKTTYRFDTNGHTVVEDSAKTDSDDYKTWYNKTKRRNTINAILITIVVCIGFYLLIVGGHP